MNTTTRTPSGARPSLHEPATGNTTRIRWDAGAVPPRTTVRAAIVLNLALAIWYFAWLADLDNASNRVLFALLIVAEVFNLVQGGCFWWTAWHDREHGPAPVLSGPISTVDVFVPRYNEPADIVGPTLAAAAQLHGAHARVFLLDDGDSAEMAALATRHGAGYIRRDSRQGAKAGNINHALQQTSAPYVAVFDCDHVPEPHFLAATMGHFRDEGVAFVQTPQYYANTEDSPIASAAAAQQELFFGVIARGKASQGAMFCCGTNVVFRRQALEEVGGFPEDSLTEDFALSIEMHERGWTSKYVSEVLAVGLAPEDMASYVSQQRRWAQGCLGGIGRVLRSRLPMRQRVQYLASAMYFLSGWTVMLYMSMPVLRLLFDVQPIGSVGTDDFILHFGPYFAASLTTVAVASGGTFTFHAFALSSATFGVHVRSLGRVVFRRHGTFVVTPKRGTTGRQLRPVGFTIVFGLTLVLAMLVGLVRDPSPSTFNNVAYAGLHVAVLASGAWPAIAAGRAATPASSVVPADEVAA